MISHILALLIGIILGGSMIGLVIIKYIESLLPEGIGIRDLIHGVGNLSEMLEDNPMMQMGMDLAGIEEPESDKDD